MIDETKIISYNSMDYEPPHQLILELLTYIIEISPVSHITDHRGLCCFMLSNSMKTLGNTCSYEIKHCVTIKSSLTFNYSDYLG